MYLAYKWNSVGKLPSKSTEFLILSRRLLLKHTNAIYLLIYL